MKGHIVLRLVTGLVLLVVLAAGAAGVGLYAYNAGIARGLADSGKLTAPSAGAWPFAYAGPYWHYGLFGPGFGLFNCFALLFGLFLVFMLVRGLLFVVFGPRHWRDAEGYRPWHGPWGRGPWGRGGYPPFFEDWHRQAHGQEKPQEPPAGPNQV